MVNESSTLGAVGPPPSPTSNVISLDSALRSSIDAISKPAVSPASPPSTTPSAAMTSEQLTATLERINERLQDNDSTVSFAVDDESGRMVIRVTDTRTDELIRQIPSEEALYFAKYIDEHLDNLVGLVLHQKA